LQTHADGSPSRANVGLRPDEHGEIGERGEELSAAGIPHKLLFLTRDGRAVVNSRARKYADRTPEQIVGRWLALEVYTGVYQRASELLVAEIDAQPKCCVHRDYHCRNLLYNDGKLGVVDFQDALHGPVMYDIASLLQDCYHTFTPEQTSRWLQYFVSISPPLQDLAPDLITRWFDWTAIQRQLKAVGIFARLHLRDAKTTHLRHILPVLARLQTTTARYPEFAGLNVQLKRCIDYGTPRLAAYP